MKFRHEWKYEISIGDAYAISARLKAVAKRDPNAKEGKYQVKSLYFDNIADVALREKLDGVNKREKFRIRYYNDDTSFIRLEKKSKINSLCNKQSAKVTKEEVELLINGEYEWMNDEKRPLVMELYVKMKDKGLRPKTIVEYTREPFVYGPGNVRVTIDQNIRTSIGIKGFLKEKCVTIPAGDSPIILEVKWDEFLPDLIKDMVGVAARRPTAFSKYAQCRIYG